MREAGSPPVAKPRRRGGDPAIRWLTIAIFAIVIIWLGAVLSALVFGIIGTPSAPRTETERNLMILGAQVDSGKATTQTYADYISALISAGQLSKAQAAIDKALPATKKDKSYLLAQQAELSLARKDYPATVTAADKAMAEAEKELKAFMAANVKANRKSTAGAVMPTAYETAALAKADALLAQKKYPEAIKAFDLYIKQSPTDSDVFVRRAEAKVLAGDKKGAEADYRTALKYIPDYQAALDGLKKIGAAQ